MPFTPIDLDVNPTPCSEADLLDNFRRLTVEIDKIQDEIEETVDVIEDRLDDLEGAGSGPNFGRLGDVSRSYTAPSLATMEWSSQVDSGSITANSTTEKITASEGGYYLVQFGASLSRLSAGADVNCFFHLCLNGGDIQGETTAIVLLPSYAGVAKVYANPSIHWITNENQIVAGDEFTVEVTCTADIEVIHAQFSVTKL